MPTFEETRHSMVTFYDRIKNLRENMGLTQSQLANRLGVTRAAVNAWEMGISFPSTALLAELSRLFGVSTDYLLGLDSHATLDITGLDDEDLTVVHSLVHLLKRKNRKSGE